MWKGHNKATVVEKYAEEFFSIIQIIAVDKKLLQAFFQDILTPAEYREIGTRWQIVKQLARGESQRKIAKDLGISIATITRGSRELLDKEGGFQRVLQKLSKKK
ncbi:MAG: Trp family transcriptional regulator [Candidatus Yanofskybacteria bacterium]|nr:Trp family transcriptional regulator [Candidatus Yanofskybacteria bacterium]